MTIEEFDYSDKRCREKEDDKQCEETRLPGRLHCAGHDTEDSVINDGKGLPYATWGW